MVLIAALLGVLATMGVATYIQNIESQIKEGGKLMEILVARENIPAGLTIGEMLDKNLVVLKKIPKRYVASGAISSPAKVDGKVLTISLSEGEQLMEGKFKDSSTAELSLRIPHNMVAISIPVDEVVGVSDKINPGDRVTVIATFTPGPGGSDVTRILLQNVEVLATSAEIQRTSKKPGIGNTSNLSKKTITLAVPPADAEKLVFAEEKGHVWIALMPTAPGRTNDTQPAETPGQTMESIFR